MTKLLERALDVVRDLSDEAQNGIALFSRVLPAPTMRSRFR
jgi:hypothetical protein